MDEVAAAEQRVAFDRALSMKQVAAHLGVSVSTVHRLLATGTLQHQRVSPRRCVIRQSALEEYLAHVSTTAPRPPAQTRARSSAK
jgi:excisionase family DNA binding protein